ncbi:MAG: ATP-binding protein, partial [Odoribacter sp.]|nr:ATP-binding protein [Odoribacter sp.]
MIEKALIKKLIAEYQEFVADIQFIPRNISVDYSHCNVFVGLRRAGKSYLMYQCVHHFIQQGMSPHSILFFNFEDDRLVDMTGSDLDTIKTCYEEMYDGKPIFFLDELQIIKGWEKFARRLADTGYLVFITGSNVNMLSSEIATTLGGRYALTEVFPFSLSEYLACKEIKLKSNWPYLQNSPVKRVFNEYFTLGGLPEVIETSQPFKRKWLSSLFDRIYFGDLIARHGIRKHDTVKSLIRKLIDSIGQPLSMNRAASIIATTGTSLKPETAADYLHN